MQTEPIGTIVNGSILEEAREGRTNLNTFDNPGIDARLEGPPFRGTRSTNRPHPAAVRTKPRVRATALHRRVASLARTAFRKATFGFWRTLVAGIAQCHVGGSRKHLRLVGKRTWSENPTSKIH